MAVAFLYCGPGTKFITEFNVRRVNVLPVIWSYVEIIYSYMLLLLFSYPVQC